MKAKKLKKIYGLGMVFLAFGIVILLYPPISSLWTDYTQKADVAGYALESEILPDVNKEKKLQEAKKYNEQLSELGAALTEPFDFDEEELLGSKYEETLNLTDIMAVIEIPAINLKLPVYHGTADETLRKGVGHLRSSSLPVGGESTYCILTAHSGLQSKTLFTNINLLKEKDMIAITVYDETIYYEVQGKEVILPTEVDKLQMVPAEDRLTLITCTPYGVNTHRLLVYSKRVYPETKTEKIYSVFTTQKKRSVFTLINGIESCLVLLSLILFVKLFVKYRELYRVTKIYKNEK